MLSILSALAATLAIYVLIAFARRKPGPRPPGPKGYPLIGNVFDTDGGLWQWTKFSEYRARWGDITSVNILGTTVVTLHTYEKAVEVLDKRGPINSSRLQIHMFNLGGLQDHVIMLPYNTQLKKCRRMLYSVMNRFKLEKYYQIQESLTARFLLTLLDTPDRFHDRIEWYNASLIFKLVYGYDTLEENDPMVAAVHNGLDHATSVTRPGYLIELIPWMRYIPAWVPYATFQRSALMLRKEYNKMREIPFERATKINQERDNDNTGDPTNFVTHWLKTIKSDAELSQAKESALVSLTAGVETTSGLLQTFVFLMQAHPLVQKQAQRELDSILGTERLLPSFQDRPHLPYVQAVLKEVLRYHPPVPAGIPHQSTADDIHSDGYMIPKGSILIPSIIEMSRDPTVYKDPEKFNPSRFLGPQAERNPYLYVFGFGRRICPGMILAQNTAFIAISMILSTFNIFPSNSTKSFSEMETYESLVSRPVPFKCHIVPRRRQGDVDQLRKKVSSTAQTSV